VPHYQQESLLNKAAQALGRLAKGKPKNYSAEEIARRSKILAGINSRKRAKAKKRRMPNVELSDVRRDSASPTKQP
jgi:hypothetical protein